MKTFSLVALFLLVGLVLADATLVHVRFPADGPRAEFFTVEGRCVGYYADGNASMICTR